MSQVKFDSATGQLFVSTMHGDNPQDVVKEVMRHVYRRHLAGAAVVLSVLVNLERNGEAVFDLLRKTFDGGRIPVKLYAEWTSVRPQAEPVTMSDETAPAITDFSPIPTAFVSKPAPAGGVPGHGLTDDQVGEIWAIVNMIGETRAKVAALPGHRALSLAVTKLDEAEMWARHRLSCDVGDKTRNPA